MGAPKGNKNSSYTPSERESLQISYLQYLMAGNHGSYFSECDHETVEGFFVSATEKQTLQRAKAKNLEWWFKRLRGLANASEPNNNATAIIFAMKNKHGWKDKTEQDITSGGEKLSSVLQVELVRPKNAVATA